MDFGKILLKVAGVAKDYLEKQQKEAESARQTRPVERPEATFVEREKTDTEWEAYFRDILRSEFSSYSIREKVPVTDLAGFVSDEKQLYKTRPTQAYKAEWASRSPSYLKQTAVPRQLSCSAKGTVTARM